MSLASSGAEGNMATHHPGQFYPGRPYRSRDTETLPDVPKQRMPWGMVAGLALALLLVVGMIIGFWRAASAPRPLIDSPDFETPPGEIQPRPR
jgi:hypothetical protein